MTCIVLAVALPALLYIGLSLPSVQNKIRNEAQQQLSEKLGVDVIIGDLGIKPFNRVVLRDIAIANDADTILKAKRLSAGVNLYETLIKGNTTIDYVELSEFGINIHRDSLNSPTNLQPIIEALRQPEKDEPSKFDLRINTIVMRQGSIRYDVNNPPLISERFDANHIYVDNFSADVSLPRVSSEQIKANLRRLTFKETSGLEITDMHASVDVSPQFIKFNDFIVEMPGSKIELENFDKSVATLGAIVSGLSTKSVNLGIKKGSFIYPPDFKAILPLAGEFNSPIDINLSVIASHDTLSIREMGIASRGNDLSVNICQASVANPFDVNQLSYNIENIDITVAKPVLSKFASFDNKKGRPQVNIPYEAKAKGSASGTLNSGQIEIIGETSTGDLIADVKYKRSSEQSPITVDAQIDVDRFNVGELLNNPDLGIINGQLIADATYTNKVTRASADIQLSDFAYRNNTISSITANAEYADGAYSVEANVADDAGDAHLCLTGDISSQTPTIFAKGTLTNFSPYNYNLTDKYVGYLLDANIEASLEGTLPDRADGSVAITGIKITNKEDRTFRLDSLVLLSRASELPRRLELHSDFISGEVEGDFTIASLGRQLKDMALTALPSLNATQLSGISQLTKDPTSSNKFNFYFVINDTEQISEYVSLPVSLLYPAEIEGTVDTKAGIASLTLDAPYLRSGNKLIESTSLGIEIDASASTDRLVFTTSVPTKHGFMPTTLAINATADAVNTGIAWKIERERDYSGDISMYTTLARNTEGELITSTDLRKSYMSFNDSVWTIHPANISSLGSKYVTVDNLNVSRRGQHVKISGVASDHPADTIDIDVLNLNLDYIFEAIGIEKVQLGGDATGRLTASSLFTPTPHLNTEGIHVKNISYNKCVFGDADVLSQWNNETQSVEIDGTIYQHNGKIAKVVGDIYPLSSSLDFKFQADETPVGFMELYMSAFASDISGFGSGNAHLWGTFSDIDMEGDLYVEDLRLKLNFTNTYFLASDSIKITPGTISLKDVTLRDPFGNTAKLDGTVHHEYFRKPTFDFSISDAHNMLVYDETSKQNPDWYGRIFVDGGATIIGEPEVVKIKVEAITAAGSTFTFVLSDMEEADEYTFLTFRDKSKIGVEEEVVVDARMTAVERLREFLANKNVETSSDYIIELVVDITPEAEVILVMDPVGGDRIRSHGQGNMQMVYTSANNDLRMYGSYTLDRGTYNFTLQDIIIKDFIINSGSSISFAGDPLMAVLDIEAVYQLNANLSDLDESFLQDKELNRTNVPVQAVLKATGNIQEPEIGFDLAFPTLSSDIYRKVRSIVSTEEMMNRQIIYLLALNRFYTPEYMNTTKGNELFSVASSTLSSQLTNMLGHLSDNWTVSPSMRSDRGDFSDVEVDVALSSRLLNNRLLLNGNFGYRDKSLNTNQFIGDFQVEYLLNRSGSIRLKAYNFYNDQNYYLRTAETTQGIGVMFKRDFDSFFSFLKPLRKNDEDSSSAEQPVENKENPDRAEDVVTDSIQNSNTIIPTIDNIEENKD